ncbi:NAD(P)/FAD-dependent oxidoreductase [Szabonella alba]|uniref:NAD(P)/FAD-dependent oxidoreductase n=1 Tax=Szabonella alba TaxID=2804194 RepID=A0A8K0Y229_9RHOB|nr:FAD/NAD(P)-binding oxidoreductase [Szabonella alba]MBL4916774.1 NAD(P)/FAD-dependent oxidoreductase [Szabonella alba]
MTAIETARPTAPRIVIVGAGPAGIRAAETLVKAGLRPVVVDEGARAGGQIYRRPPAGFQRSAEQLYGSEAGKARSLHDLFDRMAATGALEHVAQSSVLAVGGGGKDAGLHVLTPDGRRVLPCDRLILATGATDRLAPLPGWQAPGVYSLGAAQIALKAQGVALGRRIVLAGSGPLLTLVAVQLRKAGADIAAVLDTAPLTRQAAALPALLARPVFALRGMMMRARLGRLYRSGVTLQEIETDENGPVAIRWTSAAGRVQRSECDMVGLGWHLRAETQLAGLAGCRFEYSELWSQWLPQADRMGRVADGVYLAGDGLRILGADGAEIAGRLAATACLQDLGLAAPDPAADLQRLARMERFATGIARAFPWPAAQVQALPDATVICRCEGVTAGHLRQTAAYGGAEANRVKSLGRIGMGRCQGRFCQIAAAELIAGQAGCKPAEIGRLRDQAPVRPAPVGAWVQDAPP